MGLPITSSGFETAADVRGLNLICSVLLHACVEDIFKLKKHFVVIIDHAMTLFVDSAVIHQRRIQSRQTFHNGRYSKEITGPRQ